MIRRLMLPAMLVGTMVLSSSLLAEEKCSECPLGAEKECSACGICCSLCPTGAISIRTTAGYDYLYFDGSSCNNCALCKEGCPENVIDFEENLAPEVLVEQDPQLVATVKLDSCVACGERIAAREGDVCSTCRKRQVQPQELLFHASSRGRTPVQPGD